MAKRRNRVRPGPSRRETVLAMWVTEDQFARLRESLAEPDLVPPTYDELVADIVLRVILGQRAGTAVMPVRIEVDEMLAWAAATGTQLDQEAIGEYLRVVFTGPRRDARVAEATAAVVAASKDAFDRLETLAKAAAQDADAGGAPGAS